MSEDMPSAEQMTAYQKRLADHDGDERLEIVAMRNQFYEDARLYDYAGESRLREALESSSSFRVGQFHVEKDATIEGKPLYRVSGPLGERTNVGTLDEVFALTASTKN